MDVPAPRAGRLCGRRVVPHDLSDRLRPARAPGARDERFDRARARGLGRRRLRGDPAREELRRARRRDGEHRGEARVRAAGRCRRDARLRRARRRQGRRRARPGRRRGVRGLVAVAQPARRDRRDRLRGRDVGAARPDAARRSEHRRARRLPRPAHAPRAGLRARVRDGASRDVDARRDRAGRRRALPARAGGGRARADRVAPPRRQGRARAVRALVTGSEGGIGRAICARLEREGYDVVRLDVITGFDVSDAKAWEDVPDVELACLNAGVLTGELDVARLTDEQYRRILGVNVDGVVFGVRALARRMPVGGAIVATASLAPLIAPETVADAVWRAATSEGTGEAWVVQPGRDPLPFRYPGVPGPRVEGAEGARPPL